MIGIAICGLGNIGAVHLANLRSLRGVRVTGAFDLRTLPNGSNVHQFGRYEELLSDPATDAVVIATPTSTHRALTLQALAENKHVFLEKPIAGTMDDARAILEAAQASDRCVQIGFCERFNPQYLEAKRHVSRGSLGAIRAIYSSRVAPYSLGDPTWELGIFDTAVHNLDLILWLFGMQPDSVHVSAVQLYPNSAMPHSAITTLTFPGGAIATDHITWLRDDAHPLHQCARSRMSILGERGSFEIDLTQRPASLLTETSFAMADTVILGAPEYYGCLKLQFEYFLRSVQEGSPVLAPAADALAVERVVLAARESLTRGEKVMLP